MKFKVGDKIKTIEPSGHIEAGSEYEIARLPDNSSNLYQIGRGGKGWYYMSEENMELVDKPLELHKGDLVQITETVGFAVAGMKGIVMSDPDGSGTFDLQEEGGKFRVAIDVNRVKLLKTEYVEHVKHPSHYGGDNPYEVWNVIAVWEGNNPNLNWHIWTSIKHISRAGLKDPTKLIEDLEKSIQYLQKGIEVIKEKLKK